jgi:two-component sensor histidine kinase
MGIHELTTNSLKYGALSVSAGRVSVSWTRDQDRDQQILRLDWLERGGPPVAEPLRRGFGSQLLQRVLGAQLNGYVEILYRTEGVHARIEARLPHAAERPRVPGVAVGGAVGRSRDSGFSS